MNAAAVSERPADAIWTYEAKLDGYRCLAARQGNKVEVWSRRGNNFKLRWPEVARDGQPVVRVKSTVFHPALLTPEIIFSINAALRKPSSDARPGSFADTRSRGRAPDRHA